MAAGNTYEAISTTTISSSTATITLSSIPATYTDLILITTAKISGTADMWIRVNGDSGSNYQYAVLTGDGSSTGAPKGSGQSQGLLTDWNGTPTTDNTHLAICQFNNYSTTVHFKNVISRANRVVSGVDFIVSTWRSTDAITSLTLRFSGAQTFDADTVVSLYGIKAA
jgi:hypothetical protein